MSISLYARLRAVFIALLVPGLALCAHSPAAQAQTLPTLTVANAEVAEGDSGSRQMVFTATLSSPSATDVSFDWATVTSNTAPNTPTAFEDYVPANGRATIPAGKTSANFAVDVLGDTLAEGDQYFSIELSNPSGAVFQAGPMPTGTIKDDDALPIASISDASASEAGGAIAFTISLTSPAQTETAFDFILASGTATSGVDFVVPTLARVIVPVGSSAATFWVGINNDAFAESDETFSVSFIRAWGGATVGDGSAVGTIFDDDRVGAIPTLSIDDVSMAEGDRLSRNMVFTVRLSAPQSVPVSFDAATADGTATAGSDYAAKVVKGLRIPAGTTTGKFVVSIKGDSTAEADETLHVHLAKPAGALIGDGEALGTIINDDGPGGTPSISIGDVAITEGNALARRATFTVRLSAAAASAVSYTIATADGTAASPGDYVATSLSQTMAAGVVSQNFSVPIKGDTLVEPNETFTVRLSNVVGATVADDQAVGTIVNDDVATLALARFDARGLVDDIDDGNRQPQVSAKDYALLLLDSAQSLCRRAGAATVVGVIGVENSSVLRDLADAANSACAGKPRYQAVMGSRVNAGFLLTSSLTALSAPTADKEAGLVALTVQPSDDSRAFTVLLAQPLPSAATEQALRLRALERSLRARAADAQARFVLLGDQTVKFVQDLSLRDSPKLQRQPPSERILASAALLREFPRAKVEFVPMPHDKGTAQILHLKP